MSELLGHDKGGGERVRGYWSGRPISTLMSKGGLGGGRVTGVDDQSQL